MTRLGVTFLAAIGLLVPIEGSAQVLHTWSLDVTIGGADVHTPHPYVEDGAMMAEGLFAIRWKRAAGHSFVAAAGLSGDPVSNGYDASCQLLPNGECAPRVPRFISRHIVVGWEALASNKASIRLMAGPAWYAPRYGNDHADGFQVRLDLGAPKIGPLSPVISGRWMHVALYQNGAIEFFALSFGLRVH